MKGKRQERMWLMEKGMTLEREKEEMKTIQEKEMKMTQQERKEKEMKQRQMMMKAAITQIAQQMEQQNIFNENSRATLKGLIGGGQETPRPLPRNSASVAES